jgi:hypothetical protein
MIKILKRSILGSAPGASRYPLSNVGSTRLSRYFASNGKNPQTEVKKGSSSSIFLSRAAIQEQVRSIVKNLDQFYENREKTSPDEHKKIEDEHLQQLLNQRILRREFLNDGAGLTLKAISYFFATSRYRN